MTDQEFNSLKNDLSLEEMKKIQLDMMCELARFCDDNNIRYYMTGGTLLGAVRHQGFIPWDDDIDIDMPRPDYEKLIKLSNGKIGKYRLVSASDNTENDALIVKIFDDETILQETVRTINAHKTHYSHVFLDIFPLDGLPDNKFVFYFHCMIVHLLVGICRTSINGTSGRTLFKRLMRIPLVLVAKLRSVAYWKTLINKVCLRYEFDKSNNIGVLLSRNRFKDYLKKKEYLPYDDSLIFEGLSFHAPACYKKHLELLYGDYMQLPPENARNSGHELKGKRIF